METAWFLVVFCLVECWKLWAITFGSCTFSSWLSTSRAALEALRPFLANSCGPEELFFTLFRDIWFFATRFFRMVYSTSSTREASSRHKSEVGRSNHLAWLVHIREFFIPSCPGAYCLRQVSIIYSRFEISITHKYQFSFPPLRKCLSLSDVLLTVAVVAA